uniref:Thioredoxin domain-containing protein n=1 Tax=Plectus sambesii TaxID=2011161 RepID=A0A914WBB3_9BILA
MVSLATKVDYGYVPRGDSPRLYDEVLEPIVQLDEDTFADTVYNSDTAYFIEYYADWCGYCRRFVPHFSEFAEEVRLWSPIMKVAVINCADSYNKGVCKDNNITMYPTNKYIPRGSSGATDAIDIADLYKHPETMIDEIAIQIKEDYMRGRHADWPNFEWLGKTGTYGELWTGVPDTVQHYAVLFDESENGNNSMKLMLELSKYRSQLATRRSTPSNELASLMQVKDFPAVVVFKRSSASAAYGFMLDETAYEKLENIATTGDPMISVVSTTTRMSTTSTMASWSCQLNPNRCAELYFVSETDMLKAMYNALYNDVPRAGGNFTGANLTALNNFVDLLANYFPTQQGASSKLREGSGNTVSTMVIATLISI